MFPVNATKVQVKKKAKDSSPHQLSHHFFRQLPNFCCGEVDYKAIASVTASNKDPSFD
jgi:hypothetical protein